MHSCLSSAEADDPGLLTSYDHIVYGIHPSFCTPSPPLYNIQVMVIVSRLRGNIIRTALCWIVWHNVHSQQHTYMSSSYRFNRLGLSHRDPYAMHRGGCLEFYYCNMVEWFWWDSSLISTTRFPSVLWHCWLVWSSSLQKSSPKWPILCCHVKPLHCYYYHHSVYDLC